MADDANDAAWPEYLPAAEAADGLIPVAGNGLAWLTSDRHNLANREAPDSSVLVGPKISVDEWGLPLV